MTFSPDYKMKESHYLIIFIVFNMSFSKIENVKLFLKQVTPKMINARKSNERLLKYNDRYF